MRLRVDPPRAELVRLAVPTRRVPPLRAELVRLAAPARVPPLRDDVDRFAVLARFVPPELRAPAERDELFRADDDPAALVLLRLVDDPPAPERAEDGRFAVERPDDDERFAVERPEVARFAVERPEVEPLAVERVEDERFAVERFDEERFDAGRREEVERLELDRFVVDDRPDELPPEVLLRAASS